MNQTIQPIRQPLVGTVRVPGDKSISHRALLFSALATGESRIRGLLDAHDCRATRTCLEALGVEIRDAEGDGLVVCGAGVQGLRRPVGPLDCRRSGTTMRLLAGLLAGRPFASLLSGDPQLLRRPMARIVEPLREMGASIDAENGKAPLLIHGTSLRGITHRPTVASAQVKSALLLAGLTATGPTEICEPGPSRDHSERMLRMMGADVQLNGQAVSIGPVDRLDPIDLDVPGDPSSAAFWMVAATLVPGSHMMLAGVDINPTRTGLMDALRRMGASITIENERSQAGEPVGDVVVRAAPLRGIEISGDTVVRMIDEFPLLAVAASQASGPTTVRDAAELRVKESDRIASTGRLLRSLGASIQEHPDGFTVEGEASLGGGTVQTDGDHRLVMAATLAGWIADGPVTMDGAERVEDSYPGFFEQVERQGRAA